MSKWQKKKWTRAEAVPSEELNRFPFLVLFHDLNSRWVFHPIHIQSLGVSQRVTFGPNEKGWKSSTKSIFRNLFIVFPEISTLFLWCLDKSEIKIILDTSGVGDAKPKKKKKNLAERSNKLKKKDRKRQFWNSVIWYTKWTFYYTTENLGFLQR